MVSPSSILGPIIIVWMLCVVWTWFCFFGEIWHVLRQRIWSRSEGRLQRESKNDSQARSSSSKPIIVLKPLNVEGTPQLQHLNLVFNLQDSPDHKKYEDSITVAKGEGHQNTEEPTSTQKLLNTIVASQIQLKEDMTLWYSSFKTWWVAKRKTRSIKLPLSQRVRRRLMRR